MIGADLETARHALSRVAALEQFATLDPKIASLCVDLATTIIDPDFPGATVPSLDAAGALRILVAAPSMTAWRRLKPVLQAFAGPTLTSFEGTPEALDATDPVAGVIDQTKPAVTAMMRVPPDQRSQLSALRTLTRARDTLARAPNLQRVAPEPTSWLLAKFQDHLNVGRRVAASGVLARLRTELRLDSLNLEFLEVQLLATFGDWASIVDLPNLTSLCRARRTPTVTALLLEALYRVHLGAPFEASDSAEMRRRYEAHVRPLAQPMLAIPAPAKLSTQGWRVYGLEAWVAPSRSDIAESIADRRGELGWIADRLNFSAAADRPEPPMAGPIDVARDALVRADATDSNGALTTVMAALARLTPDELAHLREAEPFRSTIQVAEQVADAMAPTSWAEWLDRTADPDFVAALDVARRGKDEWSIDLGAGDPIAVQSLVAALDRAQNDALASERTAQALPFLVAWLKRDPDFPRAALRPIYASLLTLFALSSARGASTYESSQILVGALLATGLDTKTYEALIADIGEIAGEGFGVGMIYWILEIVEEFVGTSAPDAQARDSFFHATLARIAPLYSRLSSLQRAAVGQLAHELGWTLPSTAAGHDAESVDDFADRMNGLRIAIYSLTEASSRQAKAAIEAIAPSAVVDINSDHGGTARLRSLAENVDVLVMTWLSAKHAATDFIRNHRGDRPLLYAQGKGVSSILRAIEDFLSASSQ